MFQMSIDNQLMAEIYPFGGILAYLKFHFLDGFTKQSVMFLDKTKVDYNSDGKTKSNFKKDNMSTVEIKDKLGSMGIGIGRKKKTEAERANEIRKELEETK